MAETKLCLKLSDRHFGRETQLLLPNVLPWAFERIGGIRWCNKQPGSNLLKSLKTDF